MADKRDAGYAWVVLAATFLLNVIYAASYSTFGILFVEFTLYFRASKTTISWIGALYMFIGYVTSILGGALLKKFGSRIVIVFSCLLLSTSYVICGLFPTLPILFVFFGIFGGIGFLFLHMGGLVAIQYWFDKKRSLASGIFMGGQSVGVLIWPPIFRWFIDLYCWQGAMIIFGAFYLNCLVIAALLRAPPEVRNKDKNKEIVFKDSLSQSDASIFSRFISKLKDFRLYMYFLLGITIMQPSHMSIFAYTPTRAREFHLHPQETSLLISVIGILGLISRPIAGWIGDRNFVNRSLMVGISVCLSGASALVSTQFHSFKLLIISSIGFGIFSSGYMGVIGAVIVDLAGLANVEIASGIFMSILGVGNLLLYTTAGPLLDSSDSSNILFWVYGGAQVFGGLLIMTVPLLKWQLTNNEYRSKI